MVSTPIVDGVATSFGPGNHGVNCAPHRRSPLGSHHRYSRSARFSSANFLSSVAFGRTENTLADHDGIIHHNTQHHNKGEQTQHIDSRPGKGFTGISHSRAEESSPECPPSPSRPPADLRNRPSTTATSTAPMARLASIIFEPAAQVIRAVKKRHQSAVPRARVLRALPQHTCFTRITDRQLDPDPSSENIPYIEIALCCDQSAPWRWSRRNHP